MEFAVVSIGFTVLCIFAMHCQHSHLRAAEVNLEQGFSRSGMRIGM